MHLLLSRPSLPQVSIEPGSTHLGQLAHSLDIQTASQRYPRSYFVVDTSPPEVHLCRRRAPILCKACLKKSTSIVLFANSRLRERICLRKISSREPPETRCLCSDLSRQL